MRTLGHKSITGSCRERLKCTYSVSWYVTMEIDYDINKSLFLPLILYGQLLYCHQNVSFNLPRHFSSTSKVICGTRSPLLSRFGSTIPLQQ